MSVSRKMPPLPNNYSQKVAPSYQFDDDRKELRSGKQREVRNGDQNSAHQQLCAHVYFTWVHVCACTYPSLEVSQGCQNLLQSRNPANKPQAISSQVRLGFCHWHCADNTTVNGTSLPPFHLGHPTLVSPQPVRQGLSVKYEIKGMSEGVVLSVGLTPQSKVFLLLIRVTEGRDSLKTGRGEGKVDWHISWRLLITLLNLKRQGIS